jgi:hypothetical protein
MPSGRDPENYEADLRGNAWQYRGADPPAFQPYGPVRRPTHSKLN